MWLTLISVCLLLASPAATTTTGEKQNRLSFTEKNGINYTVFEHAATESKIEFVKNSGICETTPGVDQYSGYLSVGEDMNMWFWFFESRTTLDSAPLAAWFNGGPGCSSMVGLFQENGPCRFVNGEKTPSLNPYSFNNYANMLYIDQPVGVGFSYGNDTAVDSTPTAAPYVWTLLQVFYAHFPRYKSREFGIFTESYGGHYGPEFTQYITTQNTRIQNGTLPHADPINLTALGINNAWIDPSIQEKSYIDYAYENPYRSLLSPSQRDRYLAAYYDECLPALQHCSTADDEGTAAAAAAACRNANTICSTQIESPISQTGDFDVYDIRQPRDDPFPPKTYIAYLRDDAVRRAIGARVRYQQCSMDVGMQFRVTGDNARSSLPTLSSLLQHNHTFPIILWAGDADWICNWVGNEAVAHAVDFDGQQAFRKKPLQSYTVNGTQRGLVKSVDRFVFMRVFEAGHEVPYYRVYSGYAGEGCAFDLNTDGVG